MMRQSLRCAPGSCGPEAGAPSPVVTVFLGAWGLPVSGSGRFEGGFSAPSIEIGDFDIGGFF